LNVWAVLDTGAHHGVGEDSKARFDASCVETRRLAHARRTSTESTFA